MTGQGRPSRQPGSNNAEIVAEERAAACRRRASYSQQGLPPAGLPHHATRLAYADSACPFYSCCDDGFSGSDWRLSGIRTVEHQPKKNAMDEEDLRSYREAMMRGPLRALLGGDKRLARAQQAPFRYLPVRTSVVGQIGSQGIASLAMVMKSIAIVSIFAALSVPFSSTRATADDDYKKICRVNENLRVLDDDADANSCRAIAVELPGARIPNWMP